MSGLAHGRAPRPARWLVACALAAVATIAPAAAQDVTPGPSVSQGYPVSLDGEVLFRVRTPLGPISAAERARLAEQRLLAIAEDPFYTEDLLRVELEEREGRIFYRGEVVGLATMADAAAAELPLPDFLAGLAQRVKEAIAGYRERRLPEARFQAFLSLLLATAMLAALLYATARLHRRLLARTQASVEGDLARNLEHRLGITPARLRQYQERALRLVRGFAVVLLLLAYLQAVFSTVPMTRGYARAVMRYLLDPLRALWLGVLDNIGGFFFILVVVVLTYYAIRALRLVMTEAKRGKIALPGVAPEWALPLYKVLRLVFIAIAAMMIYPYIPGSSSAAFKGISLFGGALFTLGASGTASNFIGGIVLVFMGVYRMGDRVRIGDVVGDVEETNLLITRIRTPKNELVTLPNSAILRSSLVNYSVKARTEGLILHTSVTIGYDTPWRQVHELLLEAARRTRGILEHPAPFVLQTALSDFYVAYEINGTTRAPNAMASTYSELHQHIQDVFNAAGVQIMSPHYDRDPLEAKLAPPYNIGRGPDLQE